MTGKTNICVAIKADEATGDVDAAETEAGVAALA
jgi:hypothetical protein